jgi:hypothetical protein
VCVYRYVCLTVWVVMVSKLDYVLLSEERGWKETGWAAQKIILRKESF